MSEREVGGEFKDFRCGIEDSEEESWRMLMLSTLCSHYRSYSVRSRSGHVPSTHSSWHKTIHYLRWHPDGFPNSIIFSDAQPLDENERSYQLHFTLQETI